MKRFLSLSLAFILMFGTITGWASAAVNSELRFDFTQNDSGFVPVFSDYPNQKGVEEFYEFQHSYGDIPISGAGKGLFISGNNHSDDLFMGYVKKLEGFTPATSYQFTIRFKLATDVEGGLIGIGGSPGESVFVKCGIASVKPENECNSVNYFQLNIDKGNQGQGGKDMAIVGNMTKNENSCSSGYEFKELQATVTVTAGKDGCVYLIIGTDSGFEAITSYYLDDIEVRWSQAARQTVTRAETVQILYDIAGRVSADVKDYPFDDVPQDVSQTAAITWAYQKGFVSGYGNNQFGYSDVITVEQAMVMIHRFLSSPAGDTSVLNTFNDGGQVSDWAKNAIAWAIEQNMLKPTENINPKSPISYTDLVYAIGQNAVTR